MKTYTTGHCKENAQPNGCQLHNLFCEWPECDRRLIKASVAKCPFCGKSDTLTIGKASDAFSEPDECGDPSPYMHTEAYAVVCDASKPDGPGGCGASGGYKLTEDEAIAAWNRRAEAVASQPPAQAEPAPAPVGEYPALPEPKHRGPSGTGSYFDAYSADQMRAYIDADRAQRPAREVRLLTPQEIVAVLEGSALWYMFQHMGWYSAPEMSFKRHGKSLAEELLRAACKANGLTVKEQS